MEIHASFENLGKKKKRRRRRNQPKIEGASEVVSYAFETAKYLSELDVSEPIVSKKTQCRNPYIRQPSKNQSDVHSTSREFRPKTPNKKPGTVSVARKGATATQEHPCMDKSMAPNREALDCLTVSTSDDLPDSAYEESYNIEMVSSREHTSYPSLWRSAHWSMPLGLSTDSLNDIPLNEGDSVLDSRTMCFVADSIGNDWKSLARQLISDPEIDAILQKGEELENMAYDSLRKWKQKNSGAATVGVLAGHLINIKRKDLADKMIKNAVFLSPDPTFTRQSGSLDSSMQQYVLQNVCKKLKRDYQALKMKGLPWMKDIVLTLQEYYVDLVFTKLHKNGRKTSIQMNIDEIFDSTDTNDHVSRILVEGGTGSGKTTLAAKLAYDWAKKTTYMNKFDLVLLLPVCRFNGDWEETLAKAALVKDKNRPCLFEVINDESRSVLFILDGYDEASTETEDGILPLLQKELFPHVSVIVTSRPGYFTSSKEDCSETAFLANTDCSPVFNRFIDKRVTIMGFNEHQQKMFIDRHMENFTDQEKTSIREKFDQMVDKEFLRCPLFLLMLIVVFTSDKDVQNAETKTGLYKHLFNLVIQRYFCKAGEPSVDKMDLFSFNEIRQNLPHIVLMTQFSQFALEAIKRNKHIFTREKIVESYNCDPRILDLGFLKQNLSVKGFRECITYEPVHKSLLEFAAAYRLYLSYKRDRHYKLISEVTSFRPGESHASLFFPFLMGLLDENAAVLINIIISHAFEYSCKIEYLQHSLLEAKMTETTLSSLTSFLPPHWKILSGTSNSVILENNFLTSFQHEAIVRRGVQDGKIRQITWDLMHDVRLPTDVVVNTLVLDMRNVRDIEEIPNILRTNTQYKIWQKTHCKLHCKNLWCAFRNIFCQPNLALQAFLDCLKFIDFQFISFAFSRPGEEIIPDLKNQNITTLCNILTSERLKNVHMYSVTAKVGSELPLFLNVAKELMTTERLENLQIYSATMNQAQIDSIVSSSVKSSYLRNVVFHMKSSFVEEASEVFTLNVAELCNEGQKSWEWVELGNIKVTCNENTKTSFLIRHLDVESCSVSKSLMRKCNLKSLNCAASHLVDTISQWPYQESLAELNITIDRAFIYRGLYDLSLKVRNLQILALTMTSLDYSFSLPAHQWLWSALSHLRLKRFEIWKFSKNVNLAKELVESIVRCLEGEPTGFSSAKDQPQRCSNRLPAQTERIHLEYLLLGDTETDFGQQATWCLQSLKTCLELRRLQRLEMVFSTENKYPEHFQLRSLFMATKVFPYEKGFRIDHDLWGSRKDDSIYSKGKFRMSLPKKDRISVTFKQPNEIVHRRRATVSTSEI